MCEYEDCPICKQEGITIWDIAKHWIGCYPEDIFINEPKIIVAIRNHFRELLKLKKEE